MSLPAWAREIQTLLPVCSHYVLTGNVKSDAPADNDPDFDAIVTLVTGPLATQGVLSLDTDGSFIFTPEPDFKGPVTFTYELTDGEFSDQTTVTINVTNIAMDAEGNLRVGGSSCPRADDLADRGQVQADDAVLKECAPVELEEACCDRPECGEQERPGPVGRFVAKSAI